MSKPKAGPAWTRLLLAGLAGSLLAGCARMEPRLWVPDELKQSLARVDLPDIGVSRSGRSQLDGRVLSFSRSASTSEWFGVFASGSGRLSVTLEGEPALGGDCRSSREQLKLFGLQLERPLVTECQVRQGEVQTQIRLWTQATGRPDQGAELRGEWTLADGERLFVHSLHQNPAGGLMGRPLGFSIVRQGRTVALVDVSHWQPRLYLPREAQEREQLLPVALLMALLVQPGPPGG
ncbi:hypothetical protein ACS5PK_10255 [Roseateles sp. DB2]|uniref:hypothetical protein n=1 Tax=Roseateles sp. DB2 TaxID=3453717 RepID=UPI003EEF1564